MKHARTAVARVKPSMLTRVWDAVRAKDYQNVTDQVGYGGARGWYRVLEAFTGAWQRNVEVNRDSVLAYHAVYSCVTLISQDIGKCRIKLVEQSTSGIWKEVRTPSPFVPVLRRPNSYQNRIKFIEYWIACKLIHGNTYVLLGRDERGVVTRMWILDPCRVRVLVADDGAVYYSLKTDRLSQLNLEEVIVPSSEIIHDPMVTLFHPLVGVSPIFACGLAAQQGVNIQQASSLFFSNRSIPGGVLTAPGHIEDDTAQRVKDEWEQRFSGANAGRTAVLGDGLEYEPMAVPAEDSQLIEQLKWTAEMVCSCFHVPPFMIGVGQMPAYNNIEALHQAYYSQCLQSLIEALELALDEGLRLVDVKDKTYGTELDLKNLLRMDTASRYKSHSDAIGGGWKMPNEARNEEDMESVEGGDTPYMQQQNFALAALARRDKEPDPNAPDDTAVSDTAMNGAQVTSLQAMLTSVANGLLPPETARAAIAAAFPSLSAAEIDAMISPLLEFEPAVPEPTPAPAAPPAAEPAPEPAAEEETDEEAAKEVAALLTRMREKVFA